MARVAYTRGALQNLERLAEFLEREQAGAGLEALQIISSAINMLEQHPLVGRSVEHGMRELVISRGRSGYLALHRFDRGEDLVLILAVRHQREAGFLDLA